MGTIYQYIQYTLLCITYCSSAADTLRYRSLYLCYPIILSVLYLPVQNNIKVLIYELVKSGRTLQFYLLYVPAVQYTLPCITYCSSAADTLRYRSIYLCYLSILSEPYLPVQNNIKVLIYELVKSGRTLQFYLLYVHTTMYNILC